jgi:hypothetical protein
MEEWNPGVVSLPGRSLQRLGEVKSSNVIADARSREPQWPDELGSSERCEPVDNLCFAIGMRSTAPTSGSVHKRPGGIGARPMVSQPSPFNQEEFRVRYRVDTASPPRRLLRPPPVTAAGGWFIRTCAEPELSLLRHRQHCCHFIPWRQHIRLIQF